MMTEAEIPITPENYAVFFAYAEHRLPALDAFIDHLFAERRPFTPELCTQVHHRFLDTADGLEPVREANERLSRTLNAVRRDVGAACRITEDFGSVLREHAAVADHPPGGAPDGGRGERHGLGAEVSRVADQLGAIRGRLQRSERDVARLRARLAEAERDATTDPLTGLANRRQFERRLAEVAAACRRNGREVCLLLADVDHFKDVNDRHGHDVGDQVLRLIARVILDGCRPDDLAARYGGEEFAVLLPDAPLPEALETARGINRALAARSFVTRHSGHRLGRITVSIGVARLRPGEPPDAALRRADAALYRAKRLGRDRVVAA